VFAQCTIVNNPVYLSLDLNSESIGLGPSRYVNTTTDYGKYVGALESWMLMLYNTVNNADLVPGFKARSALGPTGSPGPVLLQYACKHL
jgi:hypothetical protein